LLHQTNGGIYLRIVGAAAPRRQRPANKAENRFLECFGVLRYGIIKMDFQE
jgi:hypothetical protein